MIFFRAEWKPGEQLSHILGHCLKLIKIDFRLPVEWDPQNPHRRSRSIQWTAGIKGAEHCGSSASRWLTGSRFPNSPDEALTSGWGCWEAQAIRIVISRNPRWRCNDGFWLMRNSNSGLIENWNFLEKLDSFLMCTMAKVHVSNATAFSSLFTS